MLCNQNKWGVTMKVVKKNLEAFSAVSDSLRKARNQSTVRSVKLLPVDDIRCDRVSKKPQKKASNNYYDSFMDKYLKEDYESFTTRDLVFYFRTIAEQFGYKYVVANWSKEMHFFKRLRGDYTCEEICLMISFVFESEQDYLDRSSFSPAILSSSWCNTIYRDANLWVDDKYVPRSKAPVKGRPVREYRGDTHTEEETIGEW